MTNLKEGVMVFSFAGTVIPADGRPEGCSIFPSSFGEGMATFAWDGKINGLRPCSTGCREKCGHKNGGLSE